MFLVGLFGLINADKLTNESIGQARGDNVAERGGRKTEDDVFGHMI